MDLQTRWATRWTMDSRASARWRLAGVLAAWRSELVELAAVEGKGRGANMCSHRGHHGAAEWLCLAGDEEGRW
jgi:hypothetical protein